MILPADHPEVHRPGAWHRAFGAFFGAELQSETEPLPELAAAAESAPRATDAILVVDDDPAIRATVRDVLESEGYRVVTATNGAEALEILLRARPAAVLLDMRMPVLDGWGLARELKARSISVPICVMTAARDSARWAREIGADAHLAKPFNLVDLLDELERLAPDARA